MTFLHPLLLAAGLAGISIPIIIHLLMHRRRKPVMWGAMRFLVEAYKRQRRRLMVEKWLLLAARCLLILLIALAIGRPLLGTLGLVGGGKTVYLVIDNSLASAVRDENAQAALDRHKAQAKAILSTLASSGEQGDRAAVVALASPADPIVLPATANFSSLSALIDQIPLAHARADLPGALSLVAQSIGGVDASGASLQSTSPRSAPDRTFVVVLSDFREGSVDLSPSGDVLGALKLPEGVRVLASEPAAAAAPNVSITAVEPLRSGLIDPSKAAGDASGELVRVTLSRSLEGNREAQSVGVRARLLPPGGPSAGPASVETRTLVSFAAGQETATMAVPVRADPALVKSPQASGAATPGVPASGVLVVQTDDDAIEPDNLWRRPVELREALRVGVIAPIRFGRAERIDTLDPGSWARIALSPGGGDANGGSGGGIDVVDIEPASLDQARLAGLDAVLLPRPDLIPEAGWARIRLFVESGGLAFITSPPGITVHLWGDAMTRGLGVEWSVAREAAPQTDQRLARTQAGRVAGTGAGSPGGLLSLIEGELDELLPAVNVNKILPLSPAPESGQTLLALDNAAPVLWAGPLSRAGAVKADAASPAPLGRGMVVYLGVALDLDYSDLPAKPLMVPLMQELVRQGSGQARGSWWSLAGARPRVPARTAELVELADPARPRTAGAGRDEALARLKVDPGLAQSLEPVRRAGVFRAVDDAGAARGLVVVNADPRGGRTAPQTREGVSGWLRQALIGPAAGPDPIVWLPPAAEGAPVAAAVSGLFGAVDRGSPISLPLLVAALCVAMLEVFLARRASHAQVAGPAPSLSGMLGGERGETA